MIEFQEGYTIGLSGGGEAVVGKLLGQGGQGAVYEVTLDGKPYALKWYTCHLQDKTAFKENIRQNIEDPGRSLAPDDKFLWPLFLTEDIKIGKNTSFGYVMALRSPEFTDFPAILNGKDGKGGKVAFASTEVMILAALNLVNAFRSLHRKGLSYQNLNDGNFFINTETGDVLICDNDNVTPDGKVNSGGVGGKPGYMAPEIVRGDAHPSERTDCHSLAALKNNNWFKSAVKVAIAIGNDADQDILAEFTGASETVIVSHTPEVLRKMIRTLLFFAAAVQKLRLLNNSIHSKEGKK